MHPKIPEGPRFRHNAETGEDEFLLWGGTWMEIDDLRNIGHSSKTLAYKGIARAADCANAAYRAFHEVAEAHGLQGGKTPQAWYRIHDDALNRADAWAAWAKKGDD